jgi:hypothetical protein
MTRGFVVAALTVLLLAILAPTAGAQAAQPVTVAVDRTLITTQLGHKFHFHSTFRNADAAPRSGLIAHLNVLSLHSDVYVDPEDWSSHRTKFLPPIPARGAITVNWPMEAVNHGTFAVYVTLVPTTPAGRPPAIGPAIEIAVADRKTLNSGGILPLALGIPALLGLALLAIRRRRAG